MKNSDSGPIAIVSVIPDQCPPGDQGVHHGVHQGVHEGVDHGVAPGVDRCVDHGVDHGVDLGVDHWMEGGDRHNMTFFYHTYTDTLLSFYI